MWHCTSWASVFEEIAMLSIVIGKDAIFVWLCASVYHESCILNFFQPFLGFLRVFLFLLLDHIKLNLEQCDFVFQLFKLLECDLHSTFPFPSGEHASLRSPLLAFFRGITTSVCLLVSWFIWVEPFNIIKRFSIWSWLISSILSVFFLTIR